MKELDLSSWYTLEQTIDKLRQSARTVYRLRKEKQIRCMIRREKGVRPTPVYNPEDVEKVRQAAVDAIARTKPAVANGKNGELTKATTTTTAPKTLMRAATTNNAMTRFFDLWEKALLAAEVPVLQVRPFMTIKEASAYSGLSQTFLRRMCKERMIGSMKDHGIKIRKSDLDDFAESLKKEEA